MSYLPGSHIEHTLVPIDDSSIKKKQINHALELEDKKNEVELKTCCGGSTDKRLIVILTSLTITIIIISFSCYKLSISVDCNEQHTYVGLISLLIGLWIRSPTN